MTSSLQVLVLTADAALTADLSSFLARDGHRSEQATSVIDALVRADGPEFAAVFLDQDLLCLRGENLLPCLRRFAPRATFILITSGHDLNSHLASLGSNIDDVLLKPVTAEAVRVSLTRLARLQETEQRTAQTERLAVVGQMVASFSHESRNTLQTMGLSLTMLAHQLKDRPEMLQWLQRLQTAHGDLTRLCDDVRSHVAPLILQRERCDLRALWHDAYESLSVERVGKEMVIQEHCHGLDLICRLDPLRMRQVFRILLENALAACPNPVQMEIDCTAAEELGRPAVRVAVQDNGPGLTPEQRQRIFHPFFTTKRGGTGLGLVIAQRIVEAHGGEITLGDPDRQGAEFVLSLPRGAEESCDAAVVRRSAVRTN